MAALINTHEIKSKAHLYSEEYKINRIIVDVDVIYVSFLIAILDVVFHIKSFIFVRLAFFSVLGLTILTFVHKKF